MMPRPWIYLALFLYATHLPAQNSPTSVAVDASAAKHAISTNIYGVAFGAQSDLAALNFTMNRSGGNGTSTYNWQLNASNHASDWYFESILDPPRHRATTATPSSPKPVRPTSAHSRC